MLTSSNMCLHTVTMFLLLIGLNCQMYGAVDVFENEPLTMTCTYSTSVEPETVWQSFFPDEGYEYLKYNSGKCYSNSFLNNTSLFNIDCNNTAAAVTIKHVPLYRHNTIWHCSQKNSAEPSRFQIFVKVAIKTVEIANTSTKIVTVAEHQRIELHCETSPSRPVANVTWSNGSIPIDPGNFTAIEFRNNVSDPDSLAYLRSTIVLYPDRFMNNVKLNCTGNNSLSAYPTDSVLLNITYSPDGPPIVENLQNGKYFSVIENITGTLNCTIGKSNPQSRLKWTCDDAGSFNSSAWNETSICLRVTASRRMHPRCVCESHYMSNVTSGPTVNITVLFPSTITNILAAGFNILEQEIKVIENTTLHVICIAEGNPEPEVLWLRQYKQYVKLHNFTLTDINRNDDKTTFACKANNSANDIGGQLISWNDTKGFELKVLYLPRLGDLANEFVIETWPFEKNCDVIDGNATNQSVTWVTNQQMVKPCDNLTFSSVSRNSTGNYTCRLNYTMISSIGQIVTGVIEKQFTLEILYPPEWIEVRVDEDSVEHINISRQYSLIENTPCILYCSAVGNPEPLQFSWTGPQQYNGSSILKLNASRTLNGTYVCHVNNNMTITNQSTIFGQNIREYDIEVLYPPEIEHIYDRNITEGSNVIMNCTIIPGKSTYSTIIWIRSNGSVVINNPLTITNVTRHEMGNYACQINYTMTPTYSNIKHGSSKQTFYLDVLYETEISSFYINHHKEDKFVTVNETNTVHIVCEVDSNPFSTMTISFNNNVNVTDLRQQNGIRALNYSINNSYCTDTGIYICSGNNSINSSGKPSTDQLHLYINCAPRKSPSVAVEHNISVAVHQSVTLQHSVLAYPKPNFTLYRLHDYSVVNDSTWIKDVSNATFAEWKIRYTIINVTSSDYGQYILIVYNPFGNTSQYFYLSPKDSMQVGGGNKVESPSIAGPAVGGAVGGIAAILVSIAVIYVIRKRGIPKMLNKDKHPPEYQNMNFTKDVKQHKPLPSLPTEDAHEIPERQQHHILDDHPETNTMGLKTQQKPREVKHYPEYENMNLKKIAKQHKRIPPIPSENVYEVHDQQNQVHHVEDSEDQSCPTAIELLPVINKISLSDLLSYVTSKTSEDYVHEYMKFPLGIMDSIPYTFARKPQNAPLNRYQGIYPYDHSRVVIPTEPEFFINANYIDGHSKGKAYIASLGPTVRHTLGFQTFWKMVWNEKSDVIVMLTNLQEPSGMKCEKYWADYGTTREVGDFTIQSVTEEIAAEYTVRTFNVSKKGESRPVTQLHYTAWPDKKVPEDVTSLIEFWQRVKAAPTRSLGPLVVHCSAGIGRTGTYIALDRLFEEGKTTDSVNVFDCVMSMRQQRVNMVQTQDQYVYLHQALVYCLVFDTEPVTAENIEEYVKTTSHNVYIKLFEQLKQSVEVESTYETEARTRNCDDDERNRTQADIPGDAHRIRLFLDKGSDESDYINAVYLNSFKRLGYFIIAQSPLPNTLDDFVSMLYQENCCCIVSLDDYQQKGTNNAAYLPAENQHATYGTCTLSSTMLDSNPAYSVRKLKIGHSSRYEKGMKIAHHFEYTGWKHDERIPKDVNMFVEFVQEVEEYATQLADEHSHVLVHCLTGSGRSGLFCAVSNLIQKMGQDRQVSVVNTLRQVRARRKTAIRNTEQLKFCYQSVYAFVKNYKV